jgi:hypothetical protein
VTAAASANGLAVKAAIQPGRPLAGRQSGRWRWNPDGQHESSLPSRLR